MSQGQPLEELTDDPRWSARRREALEVAKVYSSGDGDRERYDPHGWADAIRGCCRYLVFGWDRELRKVVLADGDLCRKRFCPVCQWRRSLAWFARFAEAWPQVDQDHPDARYLHLTFTVENPDTSDVREVARETLTKGWARLWQRKAVQDHALGYMKSLEVTPEVDEEGEYTGRSHPHLHVLLMVEPSYFEDGYLETREWVRLWRDCAQLSYDPVVHVRAVHPQESDADAGWNLPDGEMRRWNRRKAVLETAKYELKPEDGAEHPRWLREVTDQLHGLRRVSLGGVLRDYLRAEEPDEEEMEAGSDRERRLDQLEPEGWRFRWDQDAGRYTYQRPQAVKLGHRKAQARATGDPAVTNKLGPP